MLLPPGGHGGSGIEKRRWALEADIRAVCVEHHERVQIEPRLNLALRSDMAVIAKGDCQVLAARRAGGDYPEFCAPAW